MAQQHRVSGVATKVYRDPVTGRTNVKYHATDVVSVGPNDIELNTGGWQTNTTKTRMNQAAHEMGLGYGVYQRDHRWYVQDDRNKQTIPFTGDRVRLRR